MKTFIYRITSTTKQRSKLPVLFAFAGLMALSGSYAFAEPPEIVDKTPVHPLGEPIQPFFDAKTYHGALCDYIDEKNENSPEYYINPVKYDDRGVKNQDAAFTHVVCPVIRDNATNTNGTLGAKVFVNNVGGQELECELFSRDNYGQLLEVNRDATTAGGNQTLSLDVDASAAWGNYNIYCRFPKGTRIYSYRVTEPLRTDFNN